MTESDFSNPSSSLPASGLGGAGMLGKGLSLVRSAAQAGTSLVKTQLLRQDRTTEAEYQHRMSICQSCPGGHATFHADGSLNTCGPMLKSMTGDGHGGAGKEGAEKKTCGCVLSGKARDRKQGCPFSYWPPLNSPLPTLPEKAPASPAAPGIPGIPGGPGVLPGVAMAKAGSGGNLGGGGGNIGGVRVYSPADQKRYEAAMAGGRSGAYLLDPSRRRFLGQSAAAMVGLMATRLAFSDTDKQKYIPIRACGSGSKKYVLCGSVEGKRVNDVFVDTQGDCYQIASAKPQELGNLGSSVATPSSWAPESERGSCEFCKYYEVKKCSDSSVVGYIKKKDFYAATGNKSTGKTTSGDCVKLGSVQDPIPSGGSMASLQGNTGYTNCCFCEDCPECPPASYYEGSTLNIDLKGASSCYSTDYCATQHAQHEYIELHGVLPYVGNYTWSGTVYESMGPPDYAGGCYSMKPGGNGFWYENEPRTITVTLNPSTKQWTVNGTLHNGPSTCMGYSPLNEGCDSSDWYSGWTYTAGDSQVSL